jgi:hypothetical protein
VPLTAANLASSSIVICCDLSKPNNCLSSLLRWIKLIREVVDRRLKDLQSTDAPAARAFREAAGSSFREHTDSSRLKVFEVPLYIVANKYDVFKAQGSADRRSLMQVIRFVAHYHGATLLTTSSADSALRESFRSNMTAICFRTTAKPVCEAVLEKPVSITAGKDDFSAILTASHRALEGDTAVTSASTTSGKSRLAGSEGDVSLFLTPQGLTRDCFDRLAAHLSDVFGAVDKGEEKKGEGEEYESGGGGSSERKAENDFPEEDIDDMRAQKDAALLRYVQETERRESMLNRMNNPSSSQEQESKSESKSESRNRSSRGEENDGDSKRSSSRDKGYYLLVIYFLLLLIFFCTYAFLAGLYGNIWYKFFNTLVCNLYK